jgi:L-galactose dehydrogenase
MEYKALGSTGLKLSTIGFGGSPLGNLFGDISADTASAMVRKALDSGINYFDTSPFYGLTKVWSTLPWLDGHCHAIDSGRTLLGTPVGKRAW